MRKSLLLLLITLVFQNVIAQNEFVSTWETTSANENITVPTNNLHTYNYTIDWGDGTIENLTSHNPTHSYASPGVHTIKISGQFPRIYFNNGSQKLKILSVESWGNIVWESMAKAFYGCRNLMVNATDAPNLTNVTTLESMFRRCTNFNQNINHWNVSGITDLSNMFNDAILFNQDLNNWEVGKVTTMQAIFEGAEAFNGNIGNWETGNVINMSFMFREALNFNQDLSAWDVSQVNEMHDMFNEAISFDQSLASWNVSQVTTMRNMFEDGAGLSTVNYDATLIAWANLPNLQSGVSFRMETGTYCIARAARRKLITNHNWMIGDAGLEPSCTDDFITSWQTTMANESITIPIVSGLTYNYTVNWGDGTIDVGVTGSATHTYTTPGLYPVSISGTFPAIYFNNEGDKDKILQVEQWGKVIWQYMENAFYGCSNLMIVATDTPDLSSVTSLSGMFRGAVLLDTNLGTWDVSNITDMTNMLTGTSLSHYHYDNTIINWSQLPLLQNNVVFDAGNSAYCVSKTQRTDMINTYNWTFNDAGEETSCSSEFITQWRTTSADETITIPTASGSTYNYDIDWGDGTVETGITGSITHTYTTPGDHEVRITGIFPRIYFNDTGDKRKIRSIDKWGEIAWENMEDAFKGCTHLIINAADAPDLSNVTSLNHMFSECENLNQNINHWDVSNITSMEYVFSQATSFNQSLNAWNVANVTSLYGFFYGAEAFNKDLSNWDVSKVTDMGEMFSGAEAFNQDISNWDVSSVIYMEYMFYEASAFNQDLSNWNVANVTTMEEMFSTSAFDQDLSTWDITNVTNMEYMFDESALSTQNYDATLMGWFTDTSGVAGDGIDDVPSDIEFDGGDSEYCNAETARQSLIDTHGWSIADGGLNCATLSNNTITVNEFLLYPNPAKDLVKIKGNISVLNHVAIYDIKGELIKYQEVTTQMINIRDLVAGVYFIRLLGDDGSKIIRLVKK